MHVRRFDDVSEFYQRVAPFLMAREAEHNLMLGLCSVLRQGNMYQHPPYLALVEDAGEVVAVSMRTPPYNLILSEMANTRPVQVIADDVYHLYGEELPGVNGPKAWSKTFAECWSSLSGKPHRLKMAQRIYRLEWVRPVSGVSGEMRRATETDRDLLLRWELAFMQDAFGEADPEQAERLVETALLADPAMRGRFLWWDSGQPVSLVGYTGPTPNGMRIGPVYTPPELRGRGYGSACTAAVSQWLLDQGRKFVFLYTDLSNPTSNHIYQNIGYKPVSDVDMYRFGE
ncbi:MAG: GNAT family N-acetyltransferase [Chloroflexi bacterium]|nr:GNAT family N-acetyltransferase [Chloroflexota bacterium]